MEKRAKEIIGLPVVTFNRGTKVYDVEDMVLDPERRQVLALIVGEKSMFHSAKALPFGRISAIGPHALIIPDGKAVIDVDRDPVLKRLYNNQVVRGLKVLTDDGRKLGEVSDMLLDTTTGEIKGYYVSIGRVLNVTQGQRWLPVDRILSMGQRVLYVPADVAQEFDEQPGGWVGTLDQAGEKLRSVGAKANERLEGVGTKVTEQFRTEVPQRANAFAVGKTAHSAVMLPDGTPLLQQGEVVSEEHVERARKEGRLSQLLLAIGRGPAQQGLGTFGDQAGQSIQDIRGEAQDLWGKLTGRYTQIVDDTDDKMMQRRVRSALGRPTNRVILDSKDRIILNTGDIITNRAVQEARAAGVLDILVDSIYTERPKLSLDDLKAPTRGEASLSASGDTVPSARVEPLRSEESLVSGSRAAQRMEE